MRPPRLIALDVDGTVVEEHRLPSPRVLAAVRALARTSVVTLCTGRTVLGVAGVLDELALDRDAGVTVCSNGAVVLDTASRRVRHSSLMDPAPVVAGLRRALPGAVLGCEEIGVGQRVSGRFTGAWLAGRVRTVDDAELVRERTPKVIALWPGHTPDEVADRLATLDRETDLAGAELFTDHELPWATCTPGGVSKGRALEAVAAALGIARDDVLAVGDGDNDRPMLSWAGHGVAMGQAPAAVKAAADEVNGTVGEDGLAAVLERYL